MCEIYKSTVPVDKMVEVEDGPPLSVNDSHEDGTRVLKICHFAAKLFANNWRRSWWQIISLFHFFYISRSYQIQTFVQFSFIFHSGALSAHYSYIVTVTFLATERRDSDSILLINLITIWHDLDLKINKTSDLGIIWSHPSFSLSFYFCMDGPYPSKGS